MTKALITTEMLNGQNGNTKKKTATKKFDFTVIGDRLRTVRCSNYSNVHPTGVVNRFTCPNSPLPATTVQSKGQIFYRRNSDSIIGFFFISEEGIVFCINTIQEGPTYYTTLLNPGSTTNSYYERISCLVGDSNFKHLLFEDLSCSWEERKRSDSVLWQTPLHKRNTPTSKLTTQKHYQNMDYTTIVDRLRTVSWSNDSKPTRVI